jgi:high-affinity nickel permease
MILLPALAFGFALGVRHATDADHVAAVGTLANGRSAQRAAMLGAAWGVGHSASVLFVGGALVLMRLPMPVRVALALEFLVAVMLVALGVRSLVARKRGGSGSVSATRPLIIGVVHGLAGSAVLALLVIGTTSSAIAAAVYLICFCVGTVVGMMLVTLVLTLPTRIGARHARSFDRGLRVVAGIASIAIGLLLAHEVGVTRGLFGATPTLPSE